MSDSFQADAADVQKSHTHTFGHLMHFDTRLPLLPFDKLRAGGRRAAVAQARWMFGQLFCLADS
jgi:hypothetical protein